MVRVRGVSKVTVYNGRVSGLFTAGADADDFLRHYQGVLGREAFKEAPVRATSALKRGHRMGGRLMSGPYKRRASVYNVVEYAPYVHEGVKGRIKPRGQYLSVRAAPFSRFPFGAALKSVQGQEANPWMVRANRTAENKTRNYRRR